MLLSLCLAALGIAHDLEQVGTVVHAPIDEQSGAVQSHRWPGAYWVHNDSGDQPRLFAIDQTGAVLVPPYLADRYRTAPAKKSGNDTSDGKKDWPGLTLEGASNIDWEDIAVDEQYLYIAETGNNGNARRDLGIYVLPEPNPTAQKQARPLAYWPIAYPGQQHFPGKQWHWDCEAIFSYQGKLYFLTKHRVTGQMGRAKTSTDLYRLDTTHTDRVNTLTHVDHHDDLGGWVTAADLSPDGTKLAVLINSPNAYLWVFDAPADDDRFLQSGARSLKLPASTLKQAEGVTWIDDTQVLITNEQRDVFRVTAP